ncbi:rRNA processing protein Rrp17 [Schizosaccharomyces octosporus yFS286]|uniref:rRNA processing protein Rrp17 n=1 Tax=Schizosaccharomyces octosporus (strain yFS286) TaxID=483514 RepID=S9RGU6_SCHOY|nr:rRNA processing protein Rrp17 [Schizosaccharomyces octosporus yFS286]EPX73279.1 rRNA processing protein Rrp17 [Schizosaccharomyces octosporus yFS286]
MDNTTLLTRGDNVYNKKRGRKQRQEEIVFDKAQRQEFLTGFHKRKVERQKHAQAVAEKQQREDKRQMRKMIRQQRKQQLQERIEASRKLLGAEDTSNSEDEDSDNVTAETEDKVVIENDDEPRTREYEEDDKHVSVIIQEDDGEQSQNEEELADGIHTPQTDPPPSVPIRPHKQKQKKNRFRYESKEERRMSERKSKIKKLKHAVRRRH